MKRLTYLVNKLVELKISHTNECVEWPFSHNQFGHGNIGYKGKTTSVHRIAYEVYYGKPIENIICHKCDNPPCFNPLHLYDGTYKHNMRDVKNRNRMPKGENAGNAHLTEKEVIEIIQLLNQGDTVRSIAKQFPVTRQTIWLIKKGIMWNYLSRPWGNASPERPKAKSKKKLEPWMRKGKKGALSLDQAIEILRLLDNGITQISIANQFGISQSCISAIKLGRIKRFQHLLKSLPKMGKPKLSENEVIEIIHLLHTTDLTQIEIGKIFDITPSNIHAIKIGRIWKHLPRPW